MKTELGRKDVRVPHFLRSANSIDTSGMSFQQYRGLYQPPKLIYSNLYDNNGEVEVVRKESLEAFLASGSTSIDLLTG